MCGIAGILGQAENDASAVVQGMLEAMIHRGPDQDGAWQSRCRRVAFGHKRLSIIDLSEAGRQPMIDADSGVAITFNGECYNFRELRIELERAGHAFCSASDTEIILKAYVEWGVPFLSRLRGMFAMAIWDPRIQETLLVRDRFGIKPLYYAEIAGSLMFASELRALLATNEIARRLDPNAVAGYLWHGFVPGPDTIIKGIKRLDPGAFLRVNGTGKILEHRAYWRLPAPDKSISPEDAIQISRAELERAAGEHLISDVPLGVFLSGGVDSSVITALAQRVSNRPVTTYNIRFDESAYDESVYASRVAAALGTDHRELTLTETMFQDQLDDALGSLDQPTFDAINTYFVSRAVRDAGITVALAGTGGDELFGGYSSFSDLRRAKWLTRGMAVIPGPLRTAIAKVANTVVSRGSGEVRPQVRWGKVADLIEAKGDLLGLYQVSYSLFTREFQQSLYRLPLPARSWGLDPDRAQHLGQAIGQRDGVLEQISQLEVASFLGERLLPDTDAASMAASLEVRVPLLDHKFVESLLQLSTAQRYEPLGRKNFLKSVVSDELDAGLFDRPKAGFELPMERWCKNRLVPELESTFRDINLVRSVGLDAEALSRLWRAFQDGAPGLYWSRLWSLYILINWCKRYGVSVG